MKRQGEANDGKGHDMATVPANDGVWNVTGVQVRRRTWLKAAAALAVGGAGAWFVWGGGEPVAETGAMLGAVTHHGELKTAAEGHEGAKLYRALMTEAQAKLAGVHTIGAVFHKQERIDGKLQPLNVMDIKVRHEPLSIYIQFRTPDAGQQIIWRDGAHEGKMLVSPAGWKRKLMPIVRLTPDDPMAMAVSRRPVTNMGIWLFTQRVAALLDETLLVDPAVEITVKEGSEISGRPCTVFTFEHAKPSATAKFKQVTVFFDEVLRLPVGIECYLFNDAGTEGHLDESYLFQDLALNIPLSDADFDHENPALKFGTVK